jgi:hypothetical protein
MRMCWQEAIVVVAIVVGCGDDGSNAETDTEESTTTSPTSTTMMMSTSSSSSSVSDPSTTTMEPDTTSSSGTSTTEAESTSSSSTTGEPDTTTTMEPDTTTTGEPETTGVCAEDDDGDGICNDEDLCDDMLATHCLEFGLDGSATFTTYSMNVSGIFDDLLDHEIMVGVSLDISGVNDLAACDAAYGTPAKVFDATVVAVTMIASDPAAQTYLDDELLAELEAEGISDTIRFVAQGAGETALLQFNVGASTPPGHLFAFQDNMGYMPDCDAFDIDATLDGSNGSFRIDYVGGMGVEERIQGFGGEYTLYAVP